jgi:hypothetical protein
VAAAAAAAGGSLVKCVYLTEDDAKEMETSVSYIVALTILSHFFLNVKLYWKAQWVVHL